VGFGLPAAIGAKVAASHKTAVGIAEDTSFSTTAMEFRTTGRFGIRVDVLVLSNKFRGMALQ